MICYRITKYNPLYRNASGAYIEDEWTSYFDIGNVFDGKKLTLKQYLKAENSYIETIILFMKFLNLNFLCITNLEKPNKSIEKNKIYSNEMIKVYEEVHIGHNVSIPEIENIARLVLRENLWCKLECQSMYIHFGYEYYMYIGSNIPLTDSLIEKIEKLGLFVENFESPYLEDEQND